MIKRPAKWIVALTAAWGLTLSLAPAQETPAPAETPAAEEPAPEAPAPAETAPDAPPPDAPTPDAPTPDAPAPDAPAPDAPAPDAPAPDAPAPDAPAPDAPAPDAPVPDAPVPDAAPEPGEVTTQPAATQPSTLPAPEDPPLVVAGMTILSERVADIAQSGLREGGLEASSFRRAAALLRAAAKLEPRASGVWHLLTEAELNIGDGDAILSALVGYRKSAPRFVVPQIQFIELTASRIEAGEEELKYLRSIAAKETISPEVRAHAHVMVAKREYDRGETKAAGATVDEALKLNPVNVAALDMKYRLALEADAGPVDRATALLALIRANPVRADSLGAFGRLLAGLGMNQESADWLSRAARLAEDPQLKHDFAIDYAATEYIRGQIQPARMVLDALLKGNPSDIDALTLRLVIDRGAGDKDAYAKTREAAGAALAEQWARVARFVADEPEPTTQPAVEGAAPAPAAPAGPAPEPAAVAQQVLDANDGRKQAAFISAAADYAWFELYFNENPGAAGKWIEALESVVPDDDVQRQRLRGWMQLASQQPDEARQTLSAIRESDPLAALGVLRLGNADDKDAEKAGDDEARKLLQDYPSGLVGAIVAQALKDRNLKPEPHADAAAIRAMVQKFPRGWLDIADQPQRFYSVRVEPDHVAHAYGEPMYVKVILKNLGSEHITIGDDGVIKPGLWFDAQYQVLQPKLLQGVVFERIETATVLPAGGYIMQYVRLDQGPLAQVINADPTRRLQITGWCSTNVVQRGQNIGAGAAGQRVPFTKKITRGGFQVGNQKVREKFLEAMKQGLPEMKIRSLDLAAAYVAIARNEAARLAEPLPAEAAEADPAKREQMAKQRADAVAGAAQMATLLLDAIVAATEDEVPAVAQWAKMCLARVGEPAQRQAAVQSLLSDARWEGRLLGVIAAAQNFDRESAKLLLTKVVEEETEPVVKTYAQELHEWLLSAPATTQPAEAGAAPAPGAPAPEAPAAEPAAPPAK